MQHVLFVSRNDSAEERQKLGLPLWRNMLRVATHILQCNHTCTTAKQYAELAVHQVLPSIVPFTCARAESVPTPCFVLPVTGGQVSMLRRLKSTCSHSPES